MDYACSARYARAVAVDLLLAGVLAAVSLLAVADPPGRAFDGPLWLAVLAPCAGAAPVVVRRLWPMPALTVSFVTVLAATVVGAVGAGTLWVAYAPLALVLHTVATRLRPPWTLSALGVAVLGSGAAIAYFYDVVMPRMPPTSTPSEVPLSWPVEAGLVTVMLCASAAAGLAVAWRRRVAGDLADHAVRQAVADERLRIARELHDVVGHSLSLIAVKATVANHIAEQRPRETRAALSVIETTSQETLTEIRRVLGVLRTENDLTPIPGTGDLPELVAGFSGSGLRVGLDFRGDRELTGTMGLTVYRIVQEALTNVTRHASTDSCQVTVDTTGAEADIEIRDEGRGGEADHLGHGLIGMRERVAVFGGTVTAGPRPGGGFTVRARIPLATAKEAP